MWYALTSPTSQDVWIISRNYMCNNAYIINIDISNILVRMYKYIRQKHLW